jgi:hypothetical protein
MLTASSIGRTPAASAESAAPAASPSPQIRPAAPGSVETTPLSPTAVRIYWAAPPGTVAGYRIYRDGQPVAEAGPAARSWDDRVLEPGRTYRYRVAAFAVAAPDSEGEAAAGTLLPATSPAPMPTTEGPPSTEVMERPEPAWPERLEADVLVVGASSAGVGAAVAAARLGSRVVLLEDTTRLGGMISNGLCATDLRDVRHASGLFAEFMARVRTHYGAGDGRRYEPHVANDELKAMVYGEPRLTVFTRVRAERVLLQGRRVVGVVARHLGTRKQAVFLAAQTIDATPEGDVAAGAGCRYRVGRERRTRREPHAGVIRYFRAEDRRLPGSTGRGDRRVQSYAYLIVVKDYGPGADRTIPAPPGYDPRDYDHTLEWPKSWAVTSGKLPNDKYEINEHPQGSDLQGINDDYPEAGPERRAQIARRYRDHVLGFLHYLQTVRGLKNLGLADDEFRDTENFPPTLYVREARRVMGLVTLHEDEVADARQQAQRRSIGIGDYPMDSHAVRPKSDWQSPDMGEGEFWLFKYTPWYQIPYGVMVPRDADGLLVAMAVSATHVAYGTLRMEPVRMALGQAAGTAAHFCARLDAQPRELPARFLQDKLPPQGVALSFLPDVTPDTRHYWAIQFLGAQGFFAEGPLRPDAPTTRAEAAAWLARLRAMDVGQWTAGSGQWAAAGEGAAGDGDAPATRAELARWLVQAKGWAPEASGRHYADVPPEHPDAVTIETLTAHRIDSRLWPDRPAYGEAGPLFHPEAPLSHADFAEALFLAARDISPLLAELPGPAAWEPASAQAARP